MKNPMANGDLYMYFRAIPDSRCQTGATLSWLLSYDGPRARIGTQALLNDMPSNTPDAANDTQQISRVLHFSIVPSDALGHGVWGYTFVIMLPLLFIYARALISSLWAARAKLSKKNIPEDCEDDWKDKDIGGWQGCYSLVSMNTVHSSLVRHVN